MQEVHDLADMVRRVIRHLESINEKVPKAILELFAYLFEVKESNIERNKFDRLYNGCKVALLELVEEDKLRFNDKQEEREWFTKMDDLEKRIFNSQDQRKNEYEKLMKTKIYLDTLDCKLTIEEMLRIVDGRLPLVYYHGTPIEVLDVILENRCLIPAKRLQYLALVKQANNKKEKMIILDKQKSEYENDMDFFKRLVTDKEKAEKNIEELPKKLGIKFAIPLKEEHLYLGFTQSLRRSTVHYIELLTELIKKKYLLLAQGDRKTSPFDKRMREIKDKIKDDVFRYYPEKDSEKLDDIGYVRSEIKTEKFQRYFDMWFEYLSSLCFRQMLLEARGNPFVIKRKTEHYTNPLDIFGVRDKWYVFFGADPPYRAQENFWGSASYGTPRGMIGVDIGVIFEFKPTLYKLIAWEDIQHIDERTEGLPAAYSSKITSDLCTIKKVDFSFLLRAYTLQENFYKVKEKMDRYGIKTPLDIVDNHNRNFNNMMNEINKILGQNNLR